MTHAPAARSVGTAREVQDFLFKPDRPREIDRYIDYFGGVRADETADTCGEAVLERPA